MVEWGAIVAGTVIGLGVMVLLMSLWLATARGNEGDFVDRNLHWFAAGSAVYSLFTAGLLAGWLSGIRGWAPGFAHGATVWGVLVVVAITVGLPGSLQVFDISADAFEELAADPLWATFWSVVGGFVAAAGGGALGGVAPRPSWVYEPRESARRSERDYDDDVDLDRRDRDVFERNEERPVRATKSRRYPDEVGYAGDAGDIERRR